MFVHGIIRTIASSTKCIVRENLNKIITLEKMLVLLSKNDVIIIHLAIDDETAKKKVTLHDIS